MMNYAEMLTQMINQSELSLRQLAKRCEALELSITPSYISQLKNGKLPPPSPDVSMTLAKACGSKDESKLIFQGYLEKAPAVIKEYMLASSQLNKIMLESLCQAQGVLAEEARTHLKEMDILSTIEMTGRYVKEGSVEIIEDMVKEITLSSGGLTRDDQSKVMRVFLGDTSMAPTIPMHASLYLIPTRTDLLKDRDIIAVYIGNRRVPTLRRIFFVQGRILLIPDDKNLEILTVDSFDEVNYVGKLTGYKVDL